MKNTPDKPHNPLALLLALALLTVSLNGCGTSPAGEVAGPSVEPIGAQSPDDPTPSDDFAGAQEPEEDGASKDASFQDAPGSGEDHPEAFDSSSGENQDPAPRESFPPQSDSHLNGSVKTIGQDSFVVSQHFELPTQEEGSSIVVAPAEGSADEVLVTVHVTESTTFEIHTVKNGGVNGDADVEKQKGTFSDIQSDSFLNMDGHYEGADFQADSVIIYHFV